MTREEAIKINYLVGELMCIVHNQFKHNLFYTEKIEDFLKKREEISNYLLEHIESEE